MEAELQAHIAFFLTGKRPGTGLERIDGLGLRPALLARYRDLTTLRYDFPVVLVARRAGRDDRDFVRPLSGVMDDVRRAAAAGHHADRIAHHVLWLELAIRGLAAEGAAGTLTELWDAAVARLGVEADGDLRDSLDAARAALAVIDVDGPVLDCGAVLPARLMRHAWMALQQAKAARFQIYVTELIQRLSDLLRADAARSEAGKSASCLEAAFGSVHEDTFDFDAMSRLLTPAAPKATLPDDRRRRIAALVDVLESEATFAADDCLFTSAEVAHDAYRERLPGMAEVAKALAMAELEIAGEYQPAKHDIFFREFDGDDLDPGDLALFPDFLVTLNTALLDPIEQAALTDILSTGWPIKVLLQTDDLLSDSPSGDGQLGFGMRTRQLVGMAMAVSDVFVLQASGSHLVQCRAHLHDGLAYRGPALFSVFSGATPEADDLPPYLVAAAAMESRAFPAFVYDPSAGTDWASRFSIDANPQPDGDWPSQPFAHEDTAHHRASVDTAFTLVDFLACDRRYARHFARVPSGAWTGGTLPLADFLALDRKGLPDQAPVVRMVDRANHLHDVLVDERILREARRVRDIWHSLQELGGIHNSHAERLLTRERAHVREEALKKAARLDEAASAVPAVPAVPDVPSAPVTPVAPESTSDPYIETPRCSTCNECTQINNKMFAYNGNRQAEIVNPDAGTYEQLVLAAESCQVSIIHPGEPRNPSEPGLDALRQRAELFR